MPLTPGTRFGVYEILAPIGAGGMGEVYRAKDTRLDREVAIKVLPVSMARDHDRLVRFEREAKVLASLNHPNIAQIYGFEESGDTRALAMELVPGSTLSVPQPLETALNYAKQIAEALEAAHEKGFTHRDLKPANIMITPDGVVKVLDFGLAAIPSREAEGDPNNSPTMTMSATVAGTIMGTAAYMSPEQAAGKVVDRRSDIWSFGVVLYEMLTGGRLFDGETISHTLASVLKETIDFGWLPPSTPTPIRQLLKRCLERDVKRRLRDIGEARVAIQDYLADPATAAEQVTTPLLADSKLSRFGMGWIAAVGVLALALGGFVWRESTRPVPPEARVDIVTPPSAAPESFALSPDGQQIAYVAANGTASQLWVRSLASASARPVAGSEDARYPFWSPDSRSVGFFAEGKLKRSDLDGSSPRILADTPTGFGGTWNAEGNILFSPNFTGLSRVPAVGGQPTTVTRLTGGQTGHRQPRFLPDGKRFIFYVVGSQPGIYIGDLGKQVEKGGGIGVGTAPRRLTGADSAGEYLISGNDTGWLTFLLQNTLWARRFDASRGELSGDAVPLAQFVSNDVYQAGAFSVSRSGLIAWRTGTGGSRQLVWFNRSGERTGTLGDPVTDGLFAPELSPDGQRVEVSRGTAGARDIWLIDRDRSARFTFDAADDYAGVWSPDGRRVVFGSARTGRFLMYVKPADGSAPEQLLLAEGGLPNSWSPDGHFLLYSNGDLTLLPILPDGIGKPYPFFSTVFKEWNGVFSPDGSWVAYQSDESGRNEVYVRPFPGPGGVWQISASGGMLPRWRADGKEMYYVGQGNKLMAAAIAAHNGSITPGQPVALFTANFAGSANRPQYDVARDGRFLVNLELTAAATPPITLLQNWKPPK